MTKDETQILKGVAILLMLFLHLFNQENNVLLCKNYLFINNTPLISYIVRACNPVPFFLILGGFGLYKVNQKGDIHRFSRIFKLLTHYWIILVIFVSIGSFINPHRYPGGWVQIVGNILTVDTSYNAEWWFLFPYLCLSILSPYLCIIYNKVNNIIVLLVTFVISIITSYIISRFGEVYLYHNLWIYNPFLVLHLLFAFVFGGLMARHERYINVFSINTYLYAILLLCLILFRCCFQTSAFHTVYAGIFIFLFIKIKRAKWIDNCLSILGKHSMNMWLVHSFYCYYLFHDELYSLKYPILIYIVLIIVSLISSCVVNRIGKIIPTNSL